MSENIQTETQKTEPIELKETKIWPKNANSWKIGSKVQIEDLQGHAFKSATVVDFSPNFLLVLKVGGAILKMKQGLPFKIEDHIFYVAQRNPKHKLVGLYYVCNYTEAKNKSKTPTETVQSDSKDIAPIIEDKVCCEGTCDCSNTTE